MKKSKSRRNTSEPAKFFTLAEVAALLRLDPMTIYRLVKSGTLPCQKLAGVIRFRKKEITEFSERRAASRLP